VGGNQEAWPGAASELRSPDHAARVAVDGSLEGAHGAGIRPTLTEKDAKHGILADLLERVFDGSAHLLVSGLMEQKKIKAADLRELRKLIELRREKDEERTQ
jgi:hypothetical protein